MKINKYNALRFWEECYGSKQYAEDFHGNLMCKDGYGNNNFSVNYYTKNFDYPEKPLKYKHIRRISD